MRTSKLICFATSIFTGVLAIMLFFATQLVQHQRGVNRIPNSSDVPVEFQDLHFHQRFRREFQEFLKSPEILRFLQSLFQNPPNNLHDHSNFHDGDQLWEAINRSLEIVRFQTDTNMIRLFKELNQIRNSVLAMRNMVSDLKSGYSSTANTVAGNSSQISREISSKKIIHEKNQILQNQSHNDADRLWNCFDDSKCLLLYHNGSSTFGGRSGNRLMQLRDIENLLSQCSGAVISSTGVSPDPVVRYSPIQIFGQASCRPAWNQLPDIEHIFSRLRSRCRPLTYAEILALRNPDYTLPGVNCSKDAPGTFQRVHLHAHFPAWLDIDLDAWTAQIPNGTIVLHFRGGDVFSARPHSRYTQPVCDHYLQAIRHSGASCALLVSQDDANPCIAAVAGSFNCTHRLSMCKSPTCAFTLIARARLFGSSFSTFAWKALDAFGGVERQVYFSHCTDCPSRAKNLTRFCTETNRSELSPWKASPHQLELMKTRPARVVVC